MSEVQPRKERRKTTAVQQKKMDLKEDRRTRGKIRFNKRFARGGAKVRKMMK